VTRNGKEIRRCNKDGGAYRGSILFSQAGAAKEWGRLPSEFGLCRPEDDIAVMCAYEDTLGDIRAVERYEANKRARKQAAASKRGKHGRR
jgi:hypothetical protein